VVVLSPVARTADAKHAFERAQVVAAAVAGTRDWVNEPPGDFTPAIFAAASTNGCALNTATTHRTPQQKYPQRMQMSRPSPWSNCAGAQHAGPA
jgi:leucyl aminopeptidase